MRSFNSKWYLAVIALICLAPATLAAKPKDKDKDRDKDRCDDRRDRKCQQVPEGGSAIVYLLGAGAVCAGAIVVRSRKGQLSQS
jgi:hypothetical protein